MRRTIIIFALLTFHFCFKSQSFGDDFLDWVKNDAEKTSRKFVRAHWSLYWENYHILLHDDISMRLSLADSLCSKMIKDNESNLHRIDTLSVAEFINLKRQYNNQLRILYTIVGDIEYSRNRLLAERKDIGDFLRAGYNHYGTTTLLESYAHLRNGSASISTSYSVGFTYNPETGEGELDANTSELTPRGEVESAIITTGIALTQTPGAEDYGYAILAAYGAYKFFRYANFERQLEKLREGLRLLPSKMIKPAETYQIYLENFNSTTLSYDSLAQARIIAFANLDTICRTLIEYNFKVMSMANKVLTAKKIEVLSDRYQNVPQDYNNLFKEQLIMGALNDCYGMLQEVRKLTISSEKESDRIKKISLSESVFDARLEYWNICKWLASKEEFVPIYPQLNKFIQEFDTSQKRYAVLNENSNLFNNDDISHLTAKFGKSKDSLFKSTLNMRYLMTDNTLVPLNDRIQFQSAGQAANPKENAYFNLSGTFGAGGFYITFGSANSPYHSQFPGQPGNSEMENSPFDGGYRYDNRNPSIDIDHMTRNMDRRISDMHHANQKIRELKPEWKAANILATGKQNLAIKQKQFSSLKISSKNDNLNKDLVGDFNQQIQEFARLPLSTENMKKFFEVNNLQTDLLKLIPKKNIRPHGYTPKLLDVRSEIYGKLKDIEKDIAYEAQKSNSDFDAVYKRFTFYESRGISDPVFKNKKELSDIIAMSNSYLMTALKITSLDNSFYRSNKKFALETARTFIENTQILRYYAKGLLPQYILNDNHFYIDYTQIRNILSENVNTFYSFCDPNLSLERSDCNKFTTYYLKNIYGIGDFYNQPDGYDFIMENGAKVPIFNTSQMAPYVKENWIELGEATNQLSLNLAGLYAGMGYAVIAVKPGHVCIILPTLLKDYKTATGKMWNGLSVPDILNFARTDSEGFPLNIDLNVPLSRGWSNPEGVRIYVKPQLKDY